MGEIEACIFCRVGVEVPHQSGRLSHQRENSVNKNWWIECVESVSCLFRIPVDHTLREHLKSAQYCEKCRQLVQDVDFTFRLFARLLRRLEDIQKTILDKVSVITITNNGCTMDDDQTICDLLREGSAEVNVGIDRLKCTMNMATLLKRSKGRETDQQDEGKVIKRRRGSQSTLIDDDAKIVFIEEESDCKSVSYQDDDDDDKMSDFTHDEDPDTSEYEPSNEDKSDHLIRKKSRKSMKFKCSECNVRFATEHSLFSHRGRVHKGDTRPFHCSKCPRKFASHKALQRHGSQNCQKEGSSYLPRGEGTFPCDICSKMYASKNSLRMHKLDLHSTKHFCSICTLKFATPEDLSTHEELHANCGHPFQCVICQAVLTDSVKLKRHVTSSHTDMVVCDICGAKFSAIPNMKKHRAIHEEGYVGFKCDICGHVFHTRSYLTRHTFKHSESKSFVCEVCGKGFTFKNSLKVHMGTHEKELPFVCRICGKGFSAKCFLFEHEETHLDTLSYGCKTCGKTFKTRKSLKQHVNIHLPKDPDRKKRRVRNQKKDCAGGGLEHHGTT